MTYTSPVGGRITMGDPFVARFGETYCLTGTTRVRQGFDLWTSPNLVDWTPAPPALRRTETRWAQNNLWAPELFAYRGRHLLVYSAEGPVGGGKSAFRLCLAEAKTPGGPYRDLHAPWYDTGDACIDGHVFVDADGAAYVYFARVEVQEKPVFKLLARIFGARLKPDLSGLASEPALCVEAAQPWETPAQRRSLCNEGPFVFRDGGRLFLTYSANHYAEPFYGIGYATAPSPRGPWTKPADSRLLTADPTLGVSGPGHSGVAPSPDGKERFIVYHAHQDPARPEGPRTVNLDRSSCRTAR